MKFLPWFVQTVLCPKWVAFEYEDGDGQPELGLSIFGVIVGLYKADTIYPTSPKKYKTSRKAGIR